MKCFSFHPRIESEGKAESSKRKVIYHAKWYCRDPHMGSTLWHIPLHRIDCIRDPRYLAKMEEREKYKSFGEEEAYPGSPLST